VVPNSLGPIRSARHASAMSRKSRRNLSWAEDRHTRRAAVAAQPGPAPCNPVYLQGQRRKRSTISPWRQALLTENRPDSLNRS
jgi:hypothetical protein